MAVNMDAGSASLASWDADPGDDRTCKECGKVFGDQNLLYIHMDREHPAKCPVCTQKAFENTIACDSCDQWHHMECVGLNATNIPEEEWFCPPCRARRAPIPPPAAASASKGQKTASPARASNSGGDSIAAGKLPLGADSARSASAGKQRGTPKSAPKKTAGKSSVFPHLTPIRDFRQGLKSAMKALQTGSYECLLCSGERGGPFVCMKDSNEHFADDHWTQRLEFLDSGCETVMMVPCFHECGGERVGKDAAHYHCSCCGRVCADAEALVAHAAAEHEYSLIHAVEADRLMDVYQAVTQQLYAGQRGAAAAAAAVDVDGRAAGSATNGAGAGTASTSEEEPSSQDDDEVDDVDYEVRGAGLSEDQMEALVEEIGGKFHCMLCPPSSTLPTRNAAEHHLRNLHMTSQLVIAGRWVCLPCFQDCGPPMHYHCPLCAITSINQEILVQHTRLHPEYKEAMAEVKARAVEKEAAGAEAGTGTGTGSGVEAGAAPAPAPQAVRGKAGGRGRASAKSSAAASRSVSQETRPSRARGRAANVVSEPPPPPKVTKSAAAAPPPPPAPAPAPPTAAVLPKFAQSGLDVQFDASGTSIVVDRMPEGDAEMQKLLLTMCDSLIELYGGKYRCKLCPPPDDPSAAVLQPHDTQAAAHDHFFKCHLRFRISIGSVGHCLRCLRPCQEGAGEADGSGHYHCPFCHTLLSTQEAFITHSAEHMRTKAQQERPGHKFPLKWNVPPMDAKPRRGPHPAPAAPPPPPPSTVAAGPPTRKLAAPPPVTAADAAPPSGPGKAVVAKFVSTRGKGAGKDRTGIPTAVPGKVSHGVKAGTSGVRLPGKGGPMRLAAPPPVHARPPQPSVQAPVPAPAPAPAPKSEEPSSQLQPVITKRGRVSKPKAMADAIYSKPVRRTMAARQEPGPPTNGLPEEPAAAIKVKEDTSLGRKPARARVGALDVVGRRSPKAAAAATRGQAPLPPQPVPEDVVMAEAPKTTATVAVAAAAAATATAAAATKKHVGAKTWFYQPEISAEDVEHCVTKNSKGMFVCKLCRSSAFKSKVNAMEHFQRIHGDYSVKVLDRWIVVPCGGACPVPGEQVHYHCPVCHETVADEEDFRAHAESHGPHPPQPLPPAEDQVKPPPGDVVVRASDLVRVLPGDGYACKLCDWSGRDGLRAHLGLVHLRYRVAVDDDDGTRRRHVVMPCLLASCSARMPPRTPHYHCPLCRPTPTLVAVSGPERNAESAFLLGCLLSHVRLTHGGRGDDVGVASADVFPDELSCLVSDDLGLAGAEPGGGGGGSGWLKIDVVPVAVAGTGAGKLVVGRPGPGDVCTIAVWNEAETALRKCVHLLCDVRLDGPAVATDDKPERKRDRDAYLLGALSVFIRGDRSCALCPVGVKVGGRDSIARHFAERHLEKRVVVSVRGSGDDGSESWLCLGCRCGGRGYEAGVHYACPVCGAVVADLAEFTAHVRRHPGTNVSVEDGGASVIRAVSLPPTMTATTTTTSARGSHIVEEPGDVVSPAATKFLDVLEDLKLLRVPAASGVAPCSDPGCSATAMSGAQHFHCPMCESAVAVFPERAQLEGHMFACGGVRGGERFRSNAEDLLRREQNRLVCKLCGEDAEAGTGAGAEARGWSVADDAEARVHVSKAHLGSGISRNGHVYPLCRLPCLAKNKGAVGHLHCYGCDLVHTSGVQFLGHLSRCAGSVRRAPVNGKKRPNSGQGEEWSSADVSAEPPEKRRRMEFVPVNGLGATAEPQVERRESVVEEKEAEVEAPAPEISGGGSAEVGTVAGSEIQVQVQVQVPAPAEIEGGTAAAEVAEIAAEVKEESSVAVVPEEVAEAGEVAAVFEEVVVGPAAVGSPMDVDDAARNDQDQDQDQDMDAGNQTDEPMSVEAEPREAMEFSDKDEAMETKDDRSDRSMASPCEATIVELEQNMESPGEPRIDTGPPSPAVRIEPIPEEAEPEPEDSASTAAAEREPIVVTPDSLQAETKTTTAVEEEEREGGGSVVEVQTGEGPEHATEVGVSSAAELEREPVAETSEANEPASVPPSVEEAEEESAEEIDKPSIFDFSSDELPEVSSLDGQEASASAADSPVVIATVNAADEADPAEDSPPALATGGPDERREPEEVIPAPAQVPVPVRAPDAASDEAAETLISLNSEPPLVVAFTPDHRVRAGRGGADGEREGQGEGEALARQHSLGGDESFASSLDSGGGSDDFFTPAAVRSVPRAEFVTARPDFEDEESNDPGGLTELAPVKLSFDGEGESREKI